MWIPNVIWYIWRSKLDALLHIFSISYKSPFPSLTHSMAFERPLPSLIRIVGPFVRPFTWFCMQCIDFLTCIVIAIRANIIIASRDELTDDNLNIGIRVYSFISWTLIVSPNIVAALMAICRYIQIRFPFHCLNKRYLVFFFCSCALYSSTLAGLMCFHSDSQYHKNFMFMYLRFGMKDGMIPIVIFLLPSLICQFVSIVTSIFTVGHLYRTSENAMTERSQVNGRKSSIKILVMNMGNVMSQCIVFAVLITTVRDTDGPGRKIARFMTTVLMPPVVSSINPIIFIIFTPQVFSPWRMLWWLLRRTYDTDTDTVQYVLRFCRWNWFLVDLGDEYPVKVVIYLMKQNLFNVILQCAVSNGW